MKNSINEFHIAINAKDTKKAEEIFALSDNRLKLIENYLQQCSKIKIENVCSAFRSRGLREQALLLCESCNKNHCEVKSRLLRSTTTVHLTSENNRKMNFVNYSYSMDRISMTA